MAVAAPPAWSYPLPFCRRVNDQPQMKRKRLYSPVALDSVCVRCPGNTVAEVSQAVVCIFAGLGDEDALDREGVDQDTQNPLVGDLKA